MSALYDRRNVKKGVCHHLGDGKPACKTADELRRRANPYKYDHPEYDFGIIEDGTIVPMRPLTVIGAHTQADYSKYKYGENWWNKNAMSIVLGIDSTKYAPSQAMVNSLINFFHDKNIQHGMTMDDWYPHFQLSQTACPGAKYSKLGRNTGYLDYDFVEQSVINYKQPQSNPPSPTPSTPQPEKPQPVSKTRIPLPTTDPSVISQGHVENVGWQNIVANGEIIGTEGKSLRLEAIRIELENAPKDAHIKYSVHIENIGWVDEVQDGGLAGTQGRALRLEAIKIRLEGLDDYSVCYQVHCQDLGWQDWKSNGEIAGTVGQSLRIEALRIKLVKK